MREYYDSWDGFGFNVSYFKALKVEEKSMGRESQCLPYAGFFRGGVKKKVLEGDPKKIKGELKKIGKGSN